MINLNLIGSLGRDAEVKDAAGTKVINFSAAVNIGYGDKKSTIWVSCAKFGEKTGVADYLKKGTKVYLSGEPSLRTFTNKDGVEKTELTLRVERIELLGERPEANAAPTLPPVVDASDDLPF